MKQTRKNISMSTLVKWHKSVFSSVGWIILAKDNEMNYKVKLYRENIQDLKEKIEIKIVSTKDQNILVDLKVMLEQVTLLIKTLDNIL